MKNLFFFSLLIIMVSACNPTEDEQPPIVVNNPDYFGTWKWISSTQITLGSDLPIVTNQDSYDFLYTIDFTAEGVVEIYHGDDLVQTRNFELTTHPDFDNPWIEFSDDANGIEPNIVDGVFQLSDTVLKISGETTDTGTNQLYEKID